MVEYRATLLEFGWCPRKAVFIKGSLVDERVRLDGIAQVEHQSLSVALGNESATIFSSFSLIVAHRSSLRGLLMGAS